MSRLSLKPNLDLLIIPTLQARDGQEEELFLLGGFQLEEWLRLFEVGEQR